MSNQRQRQNAINNEIYIPPAEARGFSPTAGGARYFLVKSIADDHVVCRAWNQKKQTAGTIDVYVAKPFELRRAPWHNKTVSSITYSYTSAIARTATAAGQTAENQVVNPPWIVDKTIILAVYVPKGTGVTVSGKTVSWEEVSARAWGKP